jgi:hypothetical protein
MEPSMNPVHHADWPRSRLFALFALFSLFSLFAIPTGNLANLSGLAVLLFLVAPDSLALADRPMNQVAYCRWSPGSDSPGWLGPFLRLRFLGLV